MNKFEQNVEDILLQISRKYLFLNDGDILTLESDLMAFGLDSMNTVQMLLDIEETFDITFIDNMLTRENFASLGNILSAIQELLKEKV